MAAFGSLTGSAGGSGSEDVVRTDNWDVWLSSGRAAQVPAMVISDREIAVIFKNPADPAGTIWTNQPAIIAALAVLFEQAWNAAVPLSSSRPGATGGRAALGIAETERDLLKLLANGSTDEAAARRLGISLRTARRHVAALMTRLNAISRFQAGAEAARRGWLS